MKRYKVLAAIVILGIVSLCGRVFFLSFFRAETADSALHTGVEEFGTNRGLIFDTNLHKLVETETKHVCSVQNPSFRFNVPKRYGQNQLCAHLIGYTDSENNGVCGIEKDNNAYLKAIPNQITLKTYRDARGNILLGKGTQIDQTHLCSDSGVCLTIDADIDAIAQAAGSELGKGCVVVLRSDTGEILAEESFPAFSPNCLETALNDNTFPLINRAHSLYNVGSVFKAVVCMAALENGVSENFSYCCNGAVHCGGILFHCHKTDGHGTLNMKQALAHSCNTYFIALAQKVGAENILKMCRKLHMDKSIHLSNSIVVPAANLPQLRDLSSPAALANFSFGQGELLCTPLMTANIYALIAGGGVMHEVHCVKGKVQNGKIDSIEHESARVISQKTAQKISEFLAYAVSSGTGKAAQSQSLVIAGKTATAQTGKFVGKKEILISYFIGITRIKGERMTILVMKEGGTSGSGDCAPVFKKIAESIKEIKE